MLHFCEERNTLATICYNPILAAENKPFLWPVVQRACWFNPEGRINILAPSVHVVKFYPISNLKGMKSPFLGE
jgi:hypothetical protein